MRTWDRVSRTASDQATTRSQTTTSTQAAQGAPTPLGVAFGSAQCRLQAVQNFRKISASHSSVTMNWDEPSDKTGLAEFKIERCDDSACSSSQEWNRPGKDATSATLTNLAVNATHYFRITAVAESNSNCQDSVPSASVRADTIQQPLAAVAGLTAAAPTTNTDTRVKLTWSAPSSTANIDTFEIQRCSGSNCTGWGHVVTPCQVGHHNHGDRTDGQHHVSLPHSGQGRVRFGLPAFALVHPRVPHDRCCETCGSDRVDGYGGERERGPRLGQSVERQHHPLRVPDALVPVSSGAASGQPSPAVMRVPLPTLSAD